MEIISENCLEIVRVSRANITEFFIHGQNSAQARDIEILNHVFAFLAKNDAQAVAFRIFAGNSLREAILASNETHLATLNCPVTWVCQADGLFAVQVQAITSAVEPVTQRGALVGCRFTDDDLTYHQLSFLPEDLSAERFEQAGGVFEKIQTILTTMGLDFSNTVRTWLFTDDILAWYDKLNLARDTFFNKYDIFDKLVPASTGVGVANPTGAAMTTEVLAVEPKNETVTIQKVISPMQCSALDYKSSFSRATLIETPDHRRLLVSGTASIAPGGETIFLDDTKKQIDLSMQVAAALIHNADMDWDDMVRGIMYFKDKKDFGLFDDWCQTNNVTIPHIKVEADICRDDLLFELEIDGLVVRSS